MTTAFIYQAEIDEEQQIINHLKDVVLAAGTKDMEKLDATNTDLGYAFLHAALSLENGENWRSFCVEALAEIMLFEICDAKEIASLDNAHDHNIN